jgi:RNA polymerase sigma factor (sigma-70 family)
LWECLGIVTLGSSREKADSCQLNCEMLDRYSKHHIRMSRTTFDFAAGPAQKHWFTTTHWSVVLAATDPTDTSARTAMEELCNRYWYPLFAYIRRQGTDATEAEDLTQGFFEHLLQRERLAQANQSRGKFRTFLLAALQNYLNDQRDRSRRVKRGGRATIVSWDAQEAEQRYRLEPVDNVTPEVMFDRRWAVTTLARVRQRVREEFHANGKGDLYDLLHSHSEGENLSYEEIARRLETTDSAVKSAAHRLRMRLRDLLWEEVAQTVSTPDELEQELRNLVTLAVVEGV